MRRYLIVIERGERNYSAFAPDLPGCIATGRTRGEVLRRMQRAIAMHIEGLREEGLPVPEPATDGDWVDVEADAPAVARQSLPSRGARAVAT